jgi:hypothetical protein
VNYIHLEATTMKNFRARWVDAKLSRIFLGLLDGQKFFMRRRASAFGIPNPEDGYLVKKGRRPLKNYKMAILCFLFYRVSKIIRGTSNKKVCAEKFGYIGIL